MKGDTGTVFAEPLRAWVFSASFPAGIALLIFMRVHFGYDWPNFLPRIGLLVLCIGLGHLLCDLVVPELFNGHSQVLRRQSIYSDIWSLVAGIWLFWQLWGDIGLIIVIGTGVSLWSYSHRELLRLKGR
jgi:hypothetical protein